MGFGDQMIQRAGNRIQDIAEEKLMEGIETAFNSTVNAISNYATGSKKSSSKRKISRRRFKNPKKLRQVRRTIAHGPYTGKLAPAKVNGKKLRKGKQCLTVKKEEKGTISDPDVAYISIGQDYDRLVLHICRLIIFQLLKLARTQPVNYDNPVKGGLLRVDTNYYANPTDTAVTNFATSFAQDDTPDQMAATLFAKFKVEFLDTTVHIKNFQLFSARNTASELKATLHADYFKIGLSVYQALLVQNQTTADDSVGPSEDQSNAITANPVFLGIFDSNSNIVYQRERNDADDTTWNSWSHWNAILKTYSAAAQFFNPPNQVAEIFSNAKYSYKRILQPGEMKKIQQIQHYSGSINKIFKMFQRSFSGGTSPEPTKGGMRILSFDKMLSKVGDGSPVVIGYEMNQTIIGSIKYRYTAKQVPLYE